MLDMLTGKLVSNAKLTKLGKIVIISAVAAICVWIPLSYFFGMEKAWKDFKEEQKIVSLEQTEKGLGVGKIYLAVVGDYNTSSESMKLQQALYIIKEGEFPFAGLTWAKVHEMTSTKGTMSKGFIDAFLTPEVQKLPDDVQFCGNCTYSAVANQTYSALQLSPILLIVLIAGAIIGVLMIFTRKEDKKELQITP